MRSALPCLLLLLAGCGVPPPPASASAPARGMPVDEPAPFPSATDDPASTARAYLAVAEEARRQIDLGLAVARERRDVVLLTCLAQKRDVVRESLDALEGLAAGLSELAPDALRSAVDAMRPPTVRAHLMQREAAQCIGESAYVVGATVADVDVGPG